MARIGRVLLGTDEIDARVRELGREITGTGPDDLVVVTLMRGTMPFLADLVRALPPAVAVDFLAYNRVEGGRARLVKDLDHPIAGRHVLVVDDVVDTGLSLAFLLRVLEERDPASLRVCTLLERTDKQLVELPITHRGFALGSEYVVGYGLEFLGLYGNLPCLVAVDDFGALHADPLALREHLGVWGIW